MNSSDSIIFRELALIRKIVADETWLEGERRGCAVSPKDPVVQEKVCLIVLRIGREMRETFMRECLVAETRRAKVVTTPALKTNAQRHEAA